MKRYTLQTYEQQYRSRLAEMKQQATEAADATADVVSRGAVVDDNVDSAQSTAMLLDWQGTRCGSLTKAPPRWPLRCSFDRTWL